MGSVAEFYRDKAVLITGGTGFMGKVLLEKLLRSCPGVAKLYVLLRPKGKYNVSERRDLLLKTQIFDYLKKTDPAQLDKLVAIPGDIMQPGLGISAADSATLQEEVNVVFHSAATVKFDEVLKVSVTMNVKGTQSLLHLAKKMQKLEAFIHVSTAYCNCDRAEIDELIYPSPADPTQVMRMVEWLDDDILESITPKLLGNRPNTYTYTKALAESLIVSEKEDLPVAIVRPSIVTCAWREPIPGWVDNLNGPTGMIASAGKGLMRIMLCHEELVADVVPVDVPINLMLTAAWHTATHSPRQLNVYNCTSGTVKPIRWREVRDWGLDELRQNPMCNVLWYPGGSFTKSPVAHKFWMAVCHFLPAYILDTLIIMMGKKPLLVRIHKRMLKATQCLSYFTTHQWTFKCSNVLSLLEQMSPTDREQFHFDLKDLDWKKYLAVYCIGVRRFILKEDDNIEASRRHLKRMFYLQEACRLLFFLFTWRAIMSRSETARSLWRSLLTMLRSMVPGLSTPLAS